MITLVRGGDMLDPEELLNPGEEVHGINIASLTSRLNNSRNPLAITKQVKDRFQVEYSSHDSQYPENIGGIFTTPKFAFGNSIQARAFAIVGHDGGDLEDGDYTRAVAGLSQGLARLHEEILLPNKEQEGIALLGINEYLSGMSDGNVDFKRLNEIQAKIAEVKARILPLVRMPLFARDSVEDYKLLFEQLGLSPAQIALYIGDNSKELVKATLLKFPGLYRTIPALADESLQLAA